MKTAFAAALLATALPAAAQTTPEPIPVMLAPNVKGPESGRIIVFAQKVDAGAPTPHEVDTSEFEPTGTAIAAKRYVVAETWRRRRPMDGDSRQLPLGLFAQLPAGTYAFQAVLDRNHDYNYGGRGPGDVVSPVVEARLPGPIPKLTLDRCPCRRRDARCSRLAQYPRRAQRKPMDRRALPRLKPV